MQLLTLAVTCYSLPLISVWRTLLDTLIRMTWCPRRPPPGYGLGKNAYILVIALGLAIPNSLGVPIRVIWTPGSFRPFVSSNARVMLGLQILSVRKPALGRVVVVVIIPLFRLALTLITSGPLPF